MRVGHDLATKPPQTVKGFPEEKDSGVRAKLGGALRVYRDGIPQHELKDVLSGISLGIEVGVPWGHTRGRQEGL